MTVNPSRPIVVHKPNIHKLNKSFESRVRLGIMSVLMVNDSMDFTALKELLQVTDGNLSSHTTALEKDGMLNIKKAFVGKKTQTTYSATKVGIKAFEVHLDGLEKLIKRKS
ncbi:MAG: transcriptional regulator [Bacteroidota bacterium]|nr:transcriptional regulator [Bacteroidota bacterium]